MKQKAFLIAETFDISNLNTYLDSGWYVASTTAFIAPDNASGSGRILVIIQKD